MSKYIHRARQLAVIPAAFAMFAIGACSGEKKTDTLAQDSTLNSDIQLANKDTAAQPQLTDVPAKTTPAPAPAATAPRPRTAPSAPRREPAPAPTPRPRTSTTASGNTVTRTPGGRETAMGTIPAGTSIALTSNSRVCTNTNQVGQTVSATVANSVTGSNGAVIPAGATAQLEITELKRSDNMNDKIQMGFAVRSITFGGHTYPVSATVSSAQVDRVRNQPGSKDAQKVATGAAVGAIVGQIMGHSTKSTIIGAGVGAAAGAGTAAATANYEGCVPTGGNITIALSNSVQVHS
ncbi:MAG: hypothetical protein M3Z30_05370 [Gemmatimonadota bacterium]|nr:hypothetical protein [Gemmatimonadota bacterium]